MKRIALIVLLGIGVCLVAQTQEKLVIAAAADLQPILQQIQPEFEQKTGIALNIIYGSSGNLAAQIQNGAPYDIFMSADMTFPHRLISAHLARRDSLYRYAVGRLVIWAAPGTALDLNQLGMNALLAPSVSKIAIANPQHAPYGRAAMEAMKRAKVYDKIQSKLVLGENAMQATQFVQSGNAQLGLLPLSLVQALGQGKYWEVPFDMYPALDQGMVVLSASKQESSAETFIQYMKQMSTAMLLKRYGFEAPMTLLK